ncbi:MAG: hypothetical protein Q9M16_04685 [Mariprofundus sp.]|nr:hypothetical protein [Mariprofundus sp.]
MSSYFKFVPDAFQTASMMTVFKLFGLLLLLTPVQLTAETIKTTAQSIQKRTASNSIHFIALPYLYAFEHDQHSSAVMLRHDKGQHELSHHQWEVSTTSIPEYTTYHGQLNIIDSDHHSHYNMSADLHNIIIPIQKKTTLLPLQQRNSASSALWLRYRKKGIAAWHAPNLTPVVKAQLLAEQKRNTRLAEKLAERMADRAFYFGYDTNDDALK